jgi:ADP-ribosylglycohydrolase
MEFQERVAGCVMGTLIADALATGCHWYYDLDEMREACGPWIADYLKPRAGHYHEGLEAGELSQCGRILVLLLESLVERGEYVESDFCQRLDQQLFPLLDGTPFSGPGGYTSQSIRDAYQARVHEKKAWGTFGSLADTTEAAERAIALAARYALDPKRLSDLVIDNCRLTQNDPMVVALTTAYESVLGCVLRGDALGPELSTMLMRLKREGDLSFPFSSPDALLTPGSVMEAAQDAHVTIEPAWRVSEVYGMPCAIYHQLPAAYYLAARFSEDFETAVCQALNSGGQNLSRAKLTAALVGARVGLKGIPERWIRGLVGHDHLLELALRLGQQAQQSKSL